MTDYLKTFRYDAHPMGMLVSAIAAMSTFHPEASTALQGDHIYESEGMVNKQIFRLLGKLPTLAACAYPHANTVNTHVVLLASWKDSEKYLCDLGFADESPQLPILLREDEECLGFGGFKFKLKKGLWLNEKVWFFKIQYLNQKEMVKLDEFKHGYLFYEHLNKDDLYFEEMLSFVNTPTTVPPAKFTEYVSLALKNGGRKSILGRGDDYTYFFRDVNGTELEKLKINSNQEFRNCLKLHFNIDLNDLGSLINYTHKNLIEKQVSEK
ncbi:hypothetical protein HK099_008281 [Clydaea vesicula]|uniref:Arylamine N-acetyltransferase n=1 Tax=Clydaea vesicula TaxID=447962 RepID=A0AAD5U7Z4_9FUNG|nr:hypothetical protein HK099_008281 [Clydaea vesicula]